MKNYQPHIDGLRAVAVVPVVLFHLGVAVFPGGYVGVDVFFVISGFLITGLLLDEFSTGSYSLIEFYKRRFLRIIPALSVVLISVYLLSSFIFFRPWQAEVGKEIQSAAGFMSNIYFWMSAGYFASSSESKPLLHTWSLSLEEQFYILYPPLLYIAVKFFKSHSFHIIVALTAVSLFGAIVMSVKIPTAGFYLLPPRAWELGAGSLLAIWVHKREGNRQSVILPLVGIALVAAPVFLLTDESTFPGWNAVYPVLGAVILLGWGNSGIVGRALVSQPLVAIGRISYSLYLWHWPLIVFWRTAVGGSLNSYEMLAVAALSLILAKISTQYIERPFRTRSARKSDAKKVVLAAGGVLALIASIGFIEIKGLVSWRTYPVDVSNMASFLDYQGSDEWRDQFRVGTCMVSEDDGSFGTYDKNTCATLAADRHNVLVFGDSHAAHLWRAISEYSPSANVMQATASGCRPLRNAGGARRCIDLRNWVMNDLLSNGGVDEIFLAARWNESELTYVLPTILYLKGLVPDVVLVGPIFEYDTDLPELIARNMINGNSINFADRLVKDRPLLNEKMREIALRAGVRYINLQEQECGVGGCRYMAPDGVPLQFDYGHLTLSGARAVVKNSLLPIQ